MTATWPITSSKQKINTFFPRPPSPRRSVLGASWVVFLSKLALWILALEQDTKVFCYDSFEKAEQNGPEIVGEAFVQVIVSRFCRMKLCWTHWRHHYHYGDRKHCAMIIRLLSWVSYCVRSPYEQTFVLRSHMRLQVWINMIKSSSGDNIVLLYHRNCRKWQFVIS